MNGSRALRPILCDGHIMGYQHPFLHRLHLHTRHGSRTEDHKERHTEHDIAGADEHDVEVIRSRNVRHPNNEMSYSENGEMGNKNSPPKETKKKANQTRSALQTLFEGAVNGA